MAEPRSRRRKLPDHPYPGLRPFKAEENLIFFGREGQTDELIDRLRKRRFLAVLGSSGSGKSSLVLAGLLPALESGLMAGALSHWKIAVMRPGEHPVGYLAEALAPLVADPNDGSFALIPPRMMLETMLNASSFGLKEAATGPILRPNENLLVVVDQFEEIFRYQEENDPARANEAKAFIRLLLEATADPSLPIYIVITMRSDFLGECPRFRDLPEAINNGQYLVPRLTRAQMRDSIVGPAAVFKASLAPDLVVRMLNDIGDNPDQLPILQHALMRTWDRHTPGQEVALADYEAIGGLQNALNQHAEEIYGRLSAQGLADVIETLFRSLTELESEGKGIRRPEHVANICAAAGVDAAKVIEVVEAFRAPGCSFLMPPVPRPLSRDTLLDISHESFMRLWLRLGEWVKLEAASAAQYKRLSAAALDFKAGRVNLWRQPELGIALNWRAETEPNAAWATRYDANFAAAMTFLDDSLAALTREEEEKAAMVLLQQKSEGRRRTVRRLAVVIGLLGGMLALSIYLTFFALRKSREAQRNAQFATEQEQKALAEAKRASDEEKKANAQTLLVSQQLDQIKALRLEDSINDIAVADLNARLQVLLAMANVSNDSISRLLLTTKRQKDRIEADQQRLRKINDTLQIATREAISSADRAKTKSALLEALQLAERSLETPERDSAAHRAIRAYEQYRKFGGDTYDPKIYAALHSAKERYGLAIRFNLAYVPYAFAYNAAAPSSEYVTVNGKLVHSPVGAPWIESADDHVLESRFLAHTPDFSQLIVADVNHAVLCYDANLCVLQKEFPGHSAAVSAAVVVPGRKLLVSGDVAGKVLAAEMEGNGTARPIFQSKRGPIRSLCLQPEGKLLAVASGNAITFLNVGDFSEHRTVPLGEMLPTVLAFEQSGTKLVFGAEGGEVGVYDLLDGSVLALPVHAGRVTSLEFSPDQRYLASGSLDKTLRLWRTERFKQPPLVLKGHDSWVTGLGFSKDSKVLFSVSKDKTHRYWYTSPSAVVEQLRLAGQASNQKGGNRK